MRIAVLAYPGVPRACYQQLIGAALQLARSSRMQQMARWGWSQFSGWLHALPFEMDTGCKGTQCATKCTPPQRMREFPSTMNCWERVLHQLAWFAARGAERVTIYDHDTLVGRHIEVLVPATTNLSGAANSLENQALAGILAGLQGGVQGGTVGSIGGPYGALAGFLLGAGAGVAKSVLAGEGKDPVKAAPAPKADPAPSIAAQPTKIAEPATAAQPAKGPPPTQEGQAGKGVSPTDLQTLLPSLASLIAARLKRPPNAKATRRKRRVK